jgi:hypothetical protein
MADRVHPRHRTLKMARLAFREAHCTFDVVIRDMSDGGVKLRLPTPFVVPELFDLIILNPNTGQPVRHACERCWQHGTLAGARFIVVGSKDGKEPRLGHSHGGGTPGIQRL